MSVSMSVAMDAITSAPILTRLQACAEQGHIRAVDLHLARLAAQVPETPEQLLLLTALVSQKLSQGDICLPLKQLQHPEGLWPDELLELIHAYDWSLPLPQHATVLTMAEEQTPESPLALLVSEYERVYLHRYWQYECDVAQALLARSIPVAVDEQRLAEGLTLLFPAAKAVDPTETDWQKVAAVLALQRSFSVISGGPGTGKTTTVIKLLALYIQQCLGSGQEVKSATAKAPKIALAAPTGKAAARLAESISSAKQGLALPDGLAELIPEQATTLHRLLGVLPNTHRFRHDQYNPLHIDLLLLDEASMIDLPMMQRLLMALPQTTRLILLGDRDQLASVEAGSVLGDICSWPHNLAYSGEQSQRLSRQCQLATPLETAPSTTQAPMPIADSLSLLRKSYRFHADSGIGVLAGVVNRGESQGIETVLQSGFADLQFLPLSAEHYQQIIDRVSEFYVQLKQQIDTGTTPQALLQNMAKLQLLCAVREGDYGVNGVNERVYRALVYKGQIQNGDLWYAGRPVIITRNEPSLSLYNGDMGITAPDTDGRLKVWFLQQGKAVAFLPSRLPEHESVYAMTIHKSQGSEFERVLLLLPPKDNPVMTRELLYTGITRAKTDLLIGAQLSVLQSCSLRKTQRSGGLVKRLWG